MKTVGADLFAKGPNGRYVSSIATWFPRHQVLVTEPPLHALQRAEFQRWYRQAQLDAKLPEPKERSVNWAAAESVDLIIAPGDVILIRPEMYRLDLAFLADKQLQDDPGIPEGRIRFLGKHNQRVRQALKERGDLWRLGEAPQRQDTAPALELAPLPIGCGAIYYYNPHTGTRLLIYAEFDRLGALDDEALAAQLDEIGRYSSRRNRHGHPEIGFVSADALKFGASNFAGLKFPEMSSAVLRAKYQELRDLFAAAVEGELRKHPRDSAEVRRLLQALIAAESSAPRSTDEARSSDNDILPKVCWLPGGHFEEGEFFFSAAFLKTRREPQPPSELEPLWDPLARGFIANFIREHSHIEYLNLGRVKSPPAEPLASRGRRGVYVAEIKLRGESLPRVLVLRVLRWGIRERLGELNRDGRPKTFDQAVFETEEYIDYVLDRRLACLQLGMRLPRRVNMRRVTEVYDGIREEYRGRPLPVIYFERDYLPGTAANRLPERKLAEPEYTQALARLLGQAAAPNIVVGRTLNPQAPGVPGAVLFDNGDEIIVEGPDGLPAEMLLVDHSGAFADWRTDSLLPFARSYAAPVNDRVTQVADPKAFAEAYLAAFRAELDRLLSDYRQRRRAFDGLFKPQPQMAEGSLTHRWECVLKRLADTDPEALTQAIRQHITVL